jgi:hypothetical protein
MIALRVQDPAARHEEASENDAVCLPAGGQEQILNRQGKKDWVSSYQCLQCRQKRRSML